MTAFNKLSASMLSVESLSIQGIEGLEECLHLLHGLSNSLGGKESSDDTAAVPSPIDFHAMFLHAIPTEILHEYCSSNGHFANLTEKLKSKISSIVASEDLIGVLETVRTVQKRVDAMAKIDMYLCHDCGTFKFISSLCESSILAQLQGIEAELLQTVEMFQLMLRNCQQDGSMQCLSIQDIDKRLSLMRAVRGDGCNGILIEQMGKSYKQAIAAATSFIEVYKNKMKEQLKKSCEEVNRAVMLHVQSESRFPMLPSVLIPQSESPQLSPQPSSLFLVANTSAFDIKGSKECYDLLEQLHMICTKSCQQQQDPNQHDPLSQPDVANTDIHHMFFHAIPTELLTEYCCSTGLFADLYNYLEEELKFTLASKRLTKKLEKLQCLHCVVYPLRVFDKFLNERVSMFAQLAQLITDSTVEVQVLVSKREQERTDRLSRSKFGMTDLQRDRLQVFTDLGLPEQLQGLGLDGILVQTVLKDIDPHVDEEKNRSVDYLAGLIKAQYEAVRDATVTNMRGALAGSVPPNVPLCFLNEWTDNFAAHRMIGEGSFGQVYQGIYNNENGTLFGHVAVKRLSTNLALGDPAHRGDALASIKRELNTLQFMSHPNIIRLMGFSIPSQAALLSEDGLRQICLIYQLGGKGGLNRILMDDDKAQEMDWKKRVLTMLRISEALNYLHCHGEYSVFHRDVKSSNIVLDDDDNALIIDCGLAKFVLQDGNAALDQTMMTRTSQHFFTPGYACPMYINSKVYDAKSEIYSVGIVFMEILLVQCNVESRMGYCIMSIPWKTTLA